MYIRTVKTIYSGIQTSDFTILVNGKSGTKYHISINHHNTIVAYGDTIEELCDEFVYINKVGNMEKSHIVFENRITKPTTKQKMDYIKKYYKDELDKIRGAIYTGKGLIYVAKMNEKGEMELI